MQMADLEKPYIVIVLDDNPIYAQRRAEELYEVFVRVHPNPDIKNFTELNPLLSEWRALENPGWIYSALS